MGVSHFKSENQLEPVGAPTPLCCVTRAGTPANTGLFCFSPLCVCEDAAAGGRRAGVPRAAAPRPVPAEGGRPGGEESDTRSCGPLALALHSATPPGGTLEFSQKQAENAL